ncbi:hypothetical protein Vadar_031246 [Vaccinium darrowii]|uniref:Uncharacterized protein n=1 Tax=Vaccinium darrowii TaxID=229202 RepID=A0ACB7Y9Y1_9ERIC|nr:hypothetical protein Vadar_031246 [Vaccinium darrowii]
MEQKKMKACVNRSNARKEDTRVGELPDEILVLILSRLTVNEAARTSILSRRWEDLWKYSTGSFDLRAPDAVKDGFGWGDGSGSHLSRFSGQSNYANWVNHVLGSHRGQALDELRVFFKLDKSHEEIISSWINFAIKKQVRVLQFDLGLGLDNEHYTFPSLSHLGFSSFKNLSTLYLSRIDIADQVIADILSNCPLLEELSVRYCSTLVDVKVFVGPNSILNLKHLEIFKCALINSIEISAVNLVSFKYIGAMISLSIKNAPLLAQLEIGGGHCCWLDYDLGGLLLVHPCQLERLVLDLNSMPLVNTMKAFFRGFVEFSRVKYLELRVKLLEQDEHSILFLTVMIEVCPCLQIFRLVVTNYGTRYDRSRDLPDMWKMVSQRKPRKADITRAMDPNFPLPSRHHYDQNRFYQCLETVELVGFSGHPAELELAIYLVENAALRLQRITIDPHHQRFASGSRGFMPAEKVLAARESAKQLETKLPRSTAKLVIL